MSDPETVRHRALRTALRSAEYTLALVGGVCLIAYGGACARASLTQQRESAAFDEALRARQARLQQQIESEAPNRSEWSPARVAAYEASLDKPVRAIGRLEIPDVDLSVMVLEGTDASTLDRAVGHIPGTARPGEPGNLAIAGHRDGYFRGLRHVQTGDAISLTTLEGVAHYRVDKIEVVKPGRTDVLAPSASATLTLVTCYPFYHIGDAPSRYIVHARQVAFEPWSLDGNDVAAR
ncbi:MAG TPA: class D sortase [Myxococcota bacterium]|nr:class D sortase [Myxococcota bacterium]